MFEVVVDHADQAHTERDRRIPPLVDDAVEVTGNQAAHVADRRLVHRVEVTEEQLAVDVDLADLVTALAVPGRTLRKGQTEPLTPAVGNPPLLGSDDVGDVV